MILGKKISRIFAALFVAFGFTSLMTTQAANAMGVEGYLAESIDTSIIDCTDDDGKGSAMYCVLDIVVTVLTFTIGVAGTLGSVISGFQYMTSRDNPTQMTKAKNRMINIVIGIALYVAFVAVLQFFLPSF